MVTMNNLSHFIYFYFTIPQDILTLSMFIFVFLMLLYLCIAETWVETAFVGLFHPRSEQ